MNRPLSYLIAPLALGLLLQGTRLPAFAATASPAPKEEAGEALTLKLAEQRLAALAREGTVNPPAQATAKREGAAKKTVQAKKRKPGKVAGAKSARGSRAKGKAAARLDKALDRRLTTVEVQGVLASTRDFSGSDLSGLSLVGYDLRGAKFNRAKLHSANLERADLAETDLELADLTGANLRGASLNQARLRGARLAGARMDGAMWTDKTICREGSVGSCIE